ncbi:FecCD family ABC transporter permease [Streptomyces spiramenti]|uniref:Iron chelate uptake ABC transporter family permease subunit n=1 Tax=Streptomyces spiramenti TaxID=2720606 RepID=A0ABX1ANQ3_9ACTN|nr:iron chelate uptake ABC transporter family permease subunit [Streptomyces spiramenti]NJP67048.1 iron chelate uptake ABC transporter family permease subunit [Streptomyces spiramenti]
MTNAPSGAAPPPKAATPDPQSAVPQPAALPGTATDPGGGPARRTRTRTRLLVLAGALAALLAAVVLSLTVGSTYVPPATVLEALRHHDGSAHHITVNDLRVPRTVLGLLVGAALAVSGALMQGLTRNPLADPGLLGVNAGAGFAVALAVAVLGVTRVEDYLFFAFAGAVAATAAVYAIASQGRAGATPLRLTLVGLALGAVLMGLSRTLALLDVQTFDRMRFWDAGTVADRPAGTISAVLPWIIGGLLLALVCTRALNALSLGEHLARSVGVHVGTTRAGVVLTVTLLCGAATAAAGPLAFVGLMVPHVVRRLTGPDYRWIVPGCLLAGPVLVLVADVLGRAAVRSGELQVGVVAALIGAPLLVVLVHTRRAAAL